MTSSQRSNDSLTVSVTYGRRPRVWVPPSLASRRTSGPSPRSTATSVGCAGSTEELGVIRSPATAVRAGSFRGSVGGVLCWTTLCGAVHAVPGSPSAAAYAEPSTSTGSASPKIRALPGSLTKSARFGPWRGRTHTVGVTAVGWGTVSVRLRLTGSSGEIAIDAAHRVSLGLSAQPGRPSSSDPRSHCATAEFGGGPGTATVRRRLTGWAKPFASYCVTVKSVIPNCTPADPSSVATAGIRTHGVSPYGNAIVNGLPGLL